MAIEFISSSFVIISGGVSMISPFAINVPVFCHSDCVRVSEVLVSEKSISPPISNEMSVDVSLFASNIIIFGSLVLQVSSPTGENISQSDVSIFVSFVSVCSETIASNFGFSMVATGASWSRKMLSKSHIQDF